MANKTGPVLALDEQGIKRFIHEELEPFIADLAKLRRPDGSIPSMAQLLGKDQYEDKSLFDLAVPLAIGNMTGEGDKVNGNHLNEEAKKVAESILTILDQQEDLFGEMKQGLEKTLRDLFTAQDGSLEKIDGEKFLDLLSDVDAILSDTGSNSSKAG
ncbi:type VII secretion system-associated protein [Streptomyces sp. NPDC006654]|uniref:type VII secretion system-associated protein n=1 Tax=Streptomyces sp. NPDC006654 TaxID=3156897 RepID=UPI0033D86E2E